MGISNYDIMRESARKLFLQYDQKVMIRRFGLNYDSGYLYMEFFGRDYRIDRENGTVEWYKEELSDFIEADFNVTMTLFDILCCAKADCRASGKYDLLINLKGTGYTKDPGSGLYQTYNRAFDHRLSELAQACEKLNGKKYVVGDVSYVIPVFADLTLVFQFWESDDEFDAQIKIKWDENVLNYMHFETVHYAMAHLLQRLRELL